MKQAEHTNIIKMPTRIELLWKRHEAATKERVRIYAWELAGADGAEGYAACARVEAVVHAAYNAIEDIGDEILATEAASVTDLAIKARVLKWYGCVEDLGYYRPEAILEFFDELQTFAARSRQRRRLRPPPSPPRSGCRRMRFRGDYLDTMLRVGEGKQIVLAVAIRWRLQLD